MRMLTLKQRNTLLEIKGKAQAGIPGTLKSNKSSGSGFFLNSKCEIPCIFTQDNACVWVCKIISDNTMKQLIGWTTQWSSSVGQWMTRRGWGIKLRAYPQLYLSATKYAIGFLDVLVLHFFYLDMCRMESSSNFRGGVLKPGLKPRTTLYLEPQISFHWVSLPTYMTAVKQLFTGVLGRKEKYRHTPCASDLCRGLPWWRF